MIPKITTGTQDSVLYDSTQEIKGGIPVPFVYTDQLVGPLYPQYNVTINPLNLPPHTDYVVHILLDSVQWNKTSPEPEPVDLWVVNWTGRNMINSRLENFTYPINATENFNWSGLKTYCESIDQPRTINQPAIVGNLHDLDYNGNYTIMIINAYQGTDYEANVTIVLEATLTTYMYILEPSEINMLSTLGVALVGLAIVIKKPKEKVSTKKARAIKQDSSHTR